MPDDSLTELVTPKRLRQVAGVRFYERGESYFADGAVRSLRRSEDGIAASVQGTHRYRVRLRAEDGELDYDCSCPVGRDGAFCKHCVAVGLAWHARREDAGEDADDDRPELGELDLRRYLLGLDKEDLVALLVDQADEDERLHRRLALQAAQATPGTPADAAWKAAFSEAAGIDDYVGYRGAYDHARGIEEVVESLEGFLRAGEAERVIGLAEHGLAELEECLGSIDDSDGWMGDLLVRLQELHLEACERARPDPVALAEQLFEAEMDSSFDSFHRAVLDYAAVLGEAGRAAYRRLAEAEWAKVPALAPGDRDPDRYGARWRITSIMEALSEAEGDLEGLVAVKSRDLSLPYGFLQIATLYREAEDADRALDWAERGWQAFPGPQQDERLRDFLAEAYQDRGRREEAMELIWDGFVQRPDIDTYRRLKGHGRRAKQWPQWREKALARIRQDIAEPPKTPSGAGGLWRIRARDRSLLVEIFLHERDAESAWREAQAGGCSEGLWLELAKRRETNHPDDSVQIYKARVDALLRNTGDRVYKEAVGILQRIETILGRNGQESAFRSLLVEVRNTHRRKRNLIGMLDRKGW